MVANREQIIQSIIQQRAPFLSDLELSIQELQKRADIIEELAELQERLLREDVGATKVALQKLDLQGLLKRVKQTIKDLEVPHKRFARLTLNIGVIGRARQGKSRLLQSLSGLGAEVIPTGWHDHCTGARCEICHDPIQSPLGEMTYYSQKEFVKEALAPYYEELGLGDPPRDLATFANRPLPELPDYVPSKRKYVQAAEVYRHLKDYKEQLPVYRDLIGNPLDIIPLDKVREYVAQEDITGDKKYYKYLAVKEARIICNFGHNDVGQIALVDMPGLGDTGLGAEDLLLQALGQQVDVVLFVIMPGSGSSILDPKDVDLYDLAYGALEGVTVDRWSFMVLNRTRPTVVEEQPRGSYNSQNGSQMAQQLGPIFGDNSENCRRMQQRIKSGQTGVHGRNIKVVDCIIADCSDAQQARKEVLEPILDYLAENMHELDTLYMNAWRDNLSVLQNDIQSMLEEAKVIFGENVRRAQDEQEFQRLFQEFWEEVTLHAEELLDALAQERDIPDSKLVAYFDEKFKICRTDPQIPTLQEIRKMGAARNARSDAFSEALHILRTHLTAQFADIDTVLEFTMTDVKRRVAKFLCEKGLLAYFVAGYAEKDLSEVFFDTIGKQQTLNAFLRKNFQAFHTYRLSLRGSFQDILRDPQHLDDIVPNRTRWRADPMTAEKMYETLQELHKKTVSQIEQKVKEFMYQPKQAAHAITDEFIDQILWSKGAQMAWRAFYGLHKEHIWPENFRQSALWEQFSQEWQRLVSRAQEINQARPLYLLFRH